MKPFPAPTAILIVTCTLAISSAAFAGESDVANVTTFGADPTGARDSSSAIQNAIMSGKPVRIPPGSYQIKTPIHLTSNLAIRGEPGASALVADPEASGKGEALIFIGRGVSNVLIEGLTLDCNVSQIPSNHGRCNAIDGGANVVFDNDRIQNSAGPGLAFLGRVTPVTRSGVRNCVFSNIGAAWRDHANATLKETSPNLVFVGSADGTNVGNFIYNTKMHDIGGDAISVQGQSHFIASRNVLDLGQRGWKPTRSTAVTYGIGGFYVFNHSSDVELTDNQVHGATGNCFDLDEIQGLRVTHNVVDHCGGAGISIGRNISHLTVTDNIVSDNYESSGWEVPNIAHKGGITFSCGKPPCQSEIRDGVVKNNNFGGASSQTTQRYNVWAQHGVNFTNVQMDTRPTAE